jgi:hypothetical protein
VNAPDSVLGRSCVQSLLLLCGICCFAITQATVDLEQANGRRREQLQLLERLLELPGAARTGPIAELDGLYARRLACVPTRFGPAIVFADQCCEAELR